MYQYYRILIVGILLLMRTYGYSMNYTKAPRSNVVRLQCTSADTGNIVLNSRFFLNGTDITTTIGDTDQQHGAITFHMNRSIEGYYTCGVGNTRSDQRGIINDNFDCIKVHITKEQDVIYRINLQSALTELVQLYIEYSDIVTGQIEGITTRAEYTNILNILHIEFRSNVPFDRFNVSIALISQEKTGPLRRAMKFGIQKAKHAEMVFDVQMNGKRVKLKAISGVLDKHNKKCWYFQNGYFNPEFVEVANDTTPMKAKLAEVEARLVLPKFTDSTFTYGGLSMASFLASTPGPRPWSWGAWAPKKTSPPVS